MTRLVLLLIVAAAAGLGCRKAPSDAEREWERELRANLPPGWRVLVVTGDPGRNRFVCWFEAPGPEVRTRRVEVRVSPRPGAPGERDWAVKVHPPVSPRSQAESVSFTVPEDGAGPVEVTPGSNGDPAAVEAARPLAEEGARQVRKLKLF